MLHLLRRIWGVGVGLVMIAASLLLQLLLFLVLAVGLSLQLPGLDLRLPVVALLVLFNGVACFEYFRRGRVVGLRGTVHKLAGLVQPESSHVSMAIFLVPRGIDRILTGRERTG